MFVITNRCVFPDKKGFAIFGKRPSERGPNELRLARVNRVSGKWKIQLLPDELDDTTLAEINVQREFDERGNPIPVYASRYVAYHLLKAVNPKRMGIKGGRGRNLVFFVHGFNNTVKDVVERAEKLEKTYGVEVLVFTWPANGGGARGVTDYLSDKRDARASVGALDRCLAKLDSYLADFNDAWLKEIMCQARDKHGDDAEKRDEFIARMIRRGCPFTVNLFLHSMGNYLFKQVMKSGVYRGGRLIFDNVVLAAADVNNLDHALWVDRICSRNRIYITINENDFALGASRMKAGEQQLARLGHCTHNLDSRLAVYVDFTHAAHVRNSHSYFEGKAVEKNPRVKEFFHQALNGECAEYSISYDEAKRLYRLR